REDVLVGEAVGYGAAPQLADGVEQEQAVIREAAAGDLHVVAVVAAADVLEHADADDAVDLAANVGRLQLAIVLQPELQRQVLVALAGIRGLLLRDGHADRLDAVVGRGVRHEAAPAATDVEHAHAGLQAELAADQVELGFLGAGEVVGVLPVAARVRQPGVEHGLVEVIAEVVVGASDLPSAAAVLAVDQAGLQGQPGEAG